MKEKKGINLRTLLIILIIVLIAMVSFIGIYVKNKNSVENKIPDYILGSDLEGYRVVSLKVDDSTKDIIKDKDGKIIESATDEEIEKNGYTKIQEPVNKAENLTKENYAKAKRIIQKRLEASGIADYKVRQDAENGNIVVEIKEDSNTDDVISTLVSAGKFEIQNNDTKEVLMNHNDIENVKVFYNTTTTGTTVYLDIKFTKDGTKKLEEITRNYIKSTDQEGNSTEKKINMLIDDQSIMTTSFDTPITNGELQLSIGNSNSTDATASNTLSKYFTQARNMAILLNQEEMPITYTTQSNKYIQTSITQEQIKNCVIFIASIIFVLLVILIIVYKKNGMLAAISHIGYTAILLLILRYTNVEIGIAGLMGIAIMQIFNYAMLMVILNKLKEKDESVKKAIYKFCFVLIPAYIISIVFTFITFLPVYSMGMVMFWGITIMVIYNILVSKNLLINSKEK